MVKMEQNKRKLSDGVNARKINNMTMKLSTQILIFGSVKVHDWLPMIWLIDWVPMIELYHHV